MPTGRFAIWLTHLIRPKFSLRSLLVGVTLLALGVGIFERLDRPRRIIAWIESHGGRCKFGERELRGDFETQFRKFLPQSYFDAVDGVYSKSENADEILARAARLKSPECLGLGNSQISDAGLVHLVEVKSLEVLDLDHTQISDARLVHLVGLKSLEILDLAHTQISDQGLAQLVELKSLEILDLEHTQIGDAGLVHLVEMSSLKILDVEYTQISGPGIQQLKVSLPGCQVIGP